MSDYAGHTPGPWNENAIRALLRFGRKNDGDWDSSIYWENENLNMPSDKDARLIAAAPDLLEALEQAVREVSAMNNMLETGVYDSDIMRWEAAISKARGGQDED